MPHRQRLQFAWMPLALRNVSSGKNTYVSLGTHFTSFIEAQVSEGRYSNASDVVRAGLRLLEEEQEAKLAALRAALAEGEKSGISERGVADIWAALKAERPASTNG